MRKGILIALLAPMIFIFGMGLGTGVSTTSAMAQQISTYADSIEHSASPVEMDVAGWPLVSRLYVDGEHVGRLNKITLMRQEAGQVDSIRITIQLALAEFVAKMDECNLHFNPEILEHSEGPSDILHNWKGMFTCVADAAELVQFGTIEFDGYDEETNLYMSQELRAELDAELAEAAEEIREAMEELDDEMIELDEELAELALEITAEVAEAMAELQEELAGLDETITIEIDAAMAEHWQAVRSHVRQREDHRMSRSHARELRRELRETMRERMHEQMDSARTWRRDSTRR